MDNTLQPLRHAIKQIIAEYKPSHGLSLTLVTGLSQQGRTTLLKQSSLKQMTVDTAHPIDLYYNEHGILLDLGEAWLSDNDHLLQHTIKQINRCHRHVNITGILLCVRLDDLLESDLKVLNERCAQHGKHLEKFAYALGYPVDAALLITHLDTLNGFCDFFQHEHEKSLLEPFGFSLDATKPQSSLTELYQLKFSQFLHVMSQQVIGKVHPARSSVKRTQIREFPLQFASLRNALKCLIQAMPTQKICLSHLYFTSAEQGSLSVDRLHHKLQHEYAITTQAHHAQSTNFQAYFVEGAITAFQTYTQKALPSPQTFKNKWTLGGFGGLLFLSLGLLVYQHILTTKRLHVVETELQAYQHAYAKQEQTTQALYHLVKAASNIDKLKQKRFNFSSTKTLQEKLHQQTTTQLNKRFIPMARQEIELALQQHDLSHTERYQALKVYLLLSHPPYKTPGTIVQWYKSHWAKQASLDNTLQSKKLDLLQRALRQNATPLPLNQRIVSDNRNFLNALPVSYLYYTLAKTQLSQTHEPLNYPEFQLASATLPVIFKKSNVQQVTAQLSTLAEQYNAENWVLQRQDLQDLKPLLHQAYYQEYLGFWKRFSKQSFPKRAFDYASARETIHSATQTQNFLHLATFIRNQTAPEMGDQWREFDQVVSEQFTDLSLMSPSSLQGLQVAMQEVDTLLSTLAAVQDHGKTAFTISKLRFENRDQANPLSRLYAQSKGLPEPVAFWINQMASDIWSLLLKDTQGYINTQWHDIVYQDYRNTIADRFPLASDASNDIGLDAFDRFFANQGTLNHFTDLYVKPFIDTSKPQWTNKSVDGYRLGFSPDTLNELIRGRIITTMFFPPRGSKSRIAFSLENISLDPVVAHLHLTIGGETLHDTQDSTSPAYFHWPLSDASLKLRSIEGKRYALEEYGPWAVFRLLEKANVIQDEKNHQHLQVLFDVNGNTGRYLLKTENTLNPFTPGVLQAFHLPEVVV